MLAGTAGTQGGWKWRGQSGGRCNHLAGDGTKEVETGVVQMQSRGQILDLFPPLSPQSPTWLRFQHPFFIVQAGMKVKWKTTSIWKCLGPFPFKIPWELPASKRNVVVRVGGPHGGCLSTCLPLHTRMCTRMPIQTHTG